MSNNSESMQTKVLINGEPINGVRSIHYDCKCGTEIPVVEIELAALDGSGLDISNAELRIKFHPQTVHEAMAVLGIAGMYDEAGSPRFLFDDGK